MLCWSLTTPVAHRKDAPLSRGDGLISNRHTGVFILPTNVIFASPFFPSSQEVRWECFDFGGRWKLPLSKLLLGSDLEELSKQPLSSPHDWLEVMGWRPPLTRSSGHPGWTVGESVWSLSSDVSRMRPVCPVWPRIAICPQQKLDQMAFQGLHQFWESCLAVKFPFWFI